MDFINSQHLTYQDGYLHVFGQTGTYTYRWLIPPQSAEGGIGESAYSIEVKEGGRPAGKGNQHDVIMRWNEKDRTYHPEPEHLAINVNDFVMWRVETDEHAIPPYSVYGESKDETAFDSRALNTHDVFTHLFMVPGRYRIYINGEAVARIDVRTHREMEAGAYDQQLQDAVLMRILGKKLKPAQTDIVAGQTVVWFVEQGDHVYISAQADTDED